MIKSVEIQNFKSIKYKCFKLRSLNILLGLNGMGKSSFIQNLLTFRQSKNIHDGRLDLNGDYVNIGTASDALYQYAKDSQFATHIKFADDKDIKCVFNYKSDADYFTSQNLNNIRGLEEPLFNTAFQYLKAHRIEPKSSYPKSFSHVNDLGNLGNSGEFTAHFITEFGDINIQLEELIHPKSKIIDKLENKEIVIKTLANQINLWMEEISPNISIKTESIKDEFTLEYVYKQPHLGTTNKFKPQNVGFGITYVLPVVVALLKARSGDLIIIENPESHIHPRGQAVIGKLLALAAMGGVQIIVETHSDHIINGIRVAVKEKLMDKDNVVIYYFEKKIDEFEQYSKIINIEIDSYGELSDYPVGMLDEWNDQLLKLL